MLRLECDSCEADLVVHWCAACAKEHAYQDLKDIITRRKALGTLPAEAETVITDMLAELLGGE